ncbi:hypothetical protein GUITHDRAFT_151281 [Guillardia theta CCMP2712]|uniref:Uncharacterized protein n=1 Tax=Guillardia theta (strain CCMP2712) TaxID=905079 RepID=L1JPZ8_GUITC|nr:hypothetical protein GUITHDRAFT_151281 [Guillardia theta CCMP2712]EKX50329.1 hypothetical protein GUITHDRAFT_151281 [Guillardia theta CCMP2712]|eukprot:XP_005837309.1 hypothetical protein GUITHDRAFT_151281 [Guillardia theta CCMP2712]
MPSPSVQSCLYYVWIGLRSPAASAFDFRWGHRRISELLGSQCQYEYGVYQDGQGSWTSERMIFPFRRLCSYPIKI